MSDDRPDAAWSYQAGDWFGIFGPHITLLLPATERSRVTGLWELVDDGAAFDQVLDGLLSSGLSALSGFVLIGAGEGPTRILLRGDGVRATVDAGDGPVALEGTTLATWSERVFDGVQSLMVTVGEPDQQARHLPIEQGLVRVSRIERPEHSVEAAAPEQSEVPTEVPAEVPVEAPVAAPVEPVEPVESIEPVEVEEPSPLDEEADTNAQPSPYAALGAEVGEVPAETAMGQSPADPLTVAFDRFDADPVADAEEATVADHLDDAPPPLQSIGTWTPDGSAMPPIPPPPPTPPVAPLAPVRSESDHDGMTMAGASAAELGQPQPGIPGQPQPPSVTRPVAKLLVSNGETIDVDRVVLVGRAPEARRFTSTEQPRLVTVPSPLHEISSTHVEIRPGAGADHGSAVVTDMGSTNGTVLVQPGLGPEELKPGIAVQLIPGAVINLGDGVSIQVARP